MSLAHILFLATLGIPQMALAAPVCLRAEAERAEKAVDQLANWAAVSAARQRYARCDDGSISEGFSEAVARLLVDHWSSLPELATAAKNAPSLQTFVLRHVNSTLDTGDLERIADHAVHECPGRHAELCRRLRVAAEQALR